MLSLYWRQVQSVQFSFHAWNVLAKFVLLHTIKILVLTTIDNSKCCPKLNTVWLSFVICRIRWNSPIRHNPSNLAYLCYIPCLTSYVIFIKFAKKVRRVLIKIQYVEIENKNHVDTYIVIYRMFCIYVNVYIYGTYLMNLLNNISKMRRPHFPHSMPVVLPIWKWILKRVKSRKCFEWGVFTHSWVEVNIVDRSKC